MARVCLLVCTALVLLALPLQPALGVETYINIPTIPGDDSTPGYPGAIAASPITITPQSLSVTKDTDVASAPLFAAALGGTQLGTIRVMLYNSTPAGAPDAVLDFTNTLVSSIQLNGPTEDVSFNADNPLALFLEIPGIPGESNTPGHAGIMSISSFSVLGGQFTIEKLTDTASDDLLAANALGTPLPVARLLLYDSLPPGNAPDAVVEFQDLRVVASQSLGGVPAAEEHTLTFDTLSQPVPEPTTIALLAFAAAVAPTFRRSR